MKREALIQYVAECPFHSGTMRTVRKALKYRKLILAVKFPFSNKQNSGNTYIITHSIYCMVTIF